MAITKGSSLKGIELRLTEVMQKEKAPEHKFWNFFVSVIKFGDPCGSRTRDLQDENLTSWTTRRRGRIGGFNL